MLKRLTDLKNKGRIALFAACLMTIGLVAMLVALLPENVQAAGSETKIVRVGYVNAENYEEGGPGEYKRGFGYEYFQKIASITGWKYEYVYGSFAECYEMLENGEIDLFGNVSVKPERIGKVLFSDYPQGKDTYWLYAGAHRQDLLTKDMTKLNGTRIGVTRGSFQETLLNDWIEERELTDIEVVGCDGFNDMMTRLDNAELDAIAAPDLSTNYGYKIITMLGTSDYYFAVSKDRTDILEELNEALYEIQTAEPEYNSLLANRYYYKVASGLIVNEDEEAWLSAHNNTLRMGCQSDYLPFIGEKDGQYVGVIMTIVEALEQEYGINVELSLYPDLDAMKTAVRNNEIDIIGPVVGDFYLAEQDDLVLTEAIVQTTPVIFYRGNDYNASIQTIAVTDKSVFNSDVVGVLFPESEILECSAPDDCLAAVESGKAGCTIVPAARINIVKKNPVTDSLTTVEMTKRLDIRLLATRDNRRAATIVNKAILHSSVALSGMALAENANSELKTTVLDILKRYTLPILIVIGLIILALLYLSISLYKNRKKVVEALEAANMANEVAADSNTKLQKSNEQLTSQLGIINSVAGVYVSLFYIDLKTGSFESFGENMEPVEEVIRKSHNAKEAFFHMCESSVDPQYIESVLTFTDVETLPERLKGQPWISIQFPTPAGRWAEGMFIPVDYEDDGDVRHVMWGIRSINEQKEKELAYQHELQALADRAQSANKAKTDFLFNMSHDIRTPMNAIIGYTELLKRHHDDEAAVTDYIEKIENSNAFLLSLINNVLEMARIESGKERLDERICNLNDISISLFSVFEEQFKEKNIEVVKGSDIQHSIFWADDTKLSEILLNLMSNAVKYTPAGGRITMTIKELPPEREGWVTFKTVLSDTGIGMSGDFLPHIFDEFAREQNTTSSGIMGTGLGMPIVKRLVELMGGSIEVESELGVGTTFTLILSHRIAYDGQDATESEMEMVFDDAIFKGKRILMAEDNDLNAEIATMILEEEGFLVERAEDGIVCIDKLKKAPANYYDLILMDVQMPNMDGYKATKLIRKFEDPEKANIPIIAMTANAFEEDKINAYAAGMNAHQAKPLEIVSLKNTLGRILTHSALSRDTFANWRERFRECEEFMEFEEKYRERGIPCGCLVYEAHGAGNILYADDTLLKIFGCDSFEEFKEMVGGSFKNVVHPDDIARIEGEIQDQIKVSPQNIDRVQYRIVRKDGKVLRVDDIGRKLYIQNGKAIYYVFVVDTEEW
ncbi:MAG: transporter substrate-binding domain-containing protein [Lachnospiraceae bacterium]|nr:transporter substrate-binding domain-containing protein [Lachnospiraceae bacterium]